MIREGTFFLNAVWIRIVRSGYTHHCASLRTAYRAFDCISDCIAEVHNLEGIAVLCGYYLIQYSSCGLLATAFRGLR
jgi:hypothetical protein